MIWKEIVIVAMWLGCLAALITLAAGFEDISMFILLTTGMVSAIYLIFVRFDP